MAGNLFDIVCAEHKFKDDDDFETIFKKDMKKCEEEISKILGEDKKDLLREFLLCSQIIIFLLKPANMNIFLNMDLRLAWKCRILLANLKMSKRNEQLLVSFMCLKHNHSSFSPPRM